METEPCLRSPSSHSETSSSPDPSVKQPRQIHPFNEILQPLDVLMNVFFKLFCWSPCPCRRLLPASEAKRRRWTRRAPAASRASPLSLSLSAALQCSNRENLASSRQSSALRWTWKSWAQMMNAGLRSCPCSDAFRAAMVQILGSPLRAHFHRPRHGRVELQWCSWLWRRREDAWQGQET